MSMNIQERYTDFRPLRPYLQNLLRWPVAAGGALRLSSDPFCWQCEGAWLEARGARDRRGCDLAVLIIWANLVRGS